ncbi:hypothetical protein OHA84_36985 [Streptomyces sp. NBC_00513]|uniref:hypothetical protein n=1 Tax=unclassified Streptomyces TaxID=2593676 RepID=UPI0022550DB1|nr:hypothetical protein [Streptomyces sp. NBC_00424]MCX5078630.1 hypothetical protein [Streptomyces sp. NBC_00424]WUD39075.1 hypothetical protein OHA84_00315 [Streptomyces sp. NBC_00513]WUD45654.1 hypothetical protein OHA84_36985 [Streptomyces sp. NBC_00513]
MNNTLAVLTLAGAVLTLSGTAHASDEQYLLTGTRHINIDDSLNSYHVTSGDSVIQGVGNILQPLTQIGAPNARLVHRRPTGTGGPESDGFDTASYRRQP